MINDNLMDNEESAMGVLDVKHHFGMDNICLLGLSRKIWWFDVAYISCNKIMVMDKT